MHPAWISEYSWAVWLAVPVVLTVLAGFVAWWLNWRARPARQPTTAEAMKLHTEYLMALEDATRGAVSAGR